MGDLFGMPMEAPELPYEGQETVYASRGRVSILSVSSTVRHSRANLSSKSSAARSSCDARDPSDLWPCPALNDITLCKVHIDALDLSK